MDTLTHGGTYIQTDFYMDGLTYKWTYAHTDLVVEMLWHLKRQIFELNIIKILLHILFGEFCLVKCISERERDELEKKVVSQLDY